MSRALLISVRLWLKFYGSIVTISIPILDVIVRLTIAQTVFRSGLVKLADFDVAVMLATYEYPVSWMSPHTAAVIGLLIEVVVPVLLTLGLFTRSAAVALAALLAVSQASYLALDSNLFMIALSLWYIVRGAGAFSLDRLLARGIEDSAFPLAPSAVGFGAIVTQYGVPPLLLSFRLWLGLSLLMAAGMVPMMADNLILPLATFAAIPPSLLLFFAALAISGFAFPVLTTGLFLSLSAMTMMGTAVDWTAFSLLFVVTIGLHGIGSFGVDSLIGDWLEKHILFDHQPDGIPADWPHVVVVGGGFGGLACVANLKNLPVRITLIDQHNYHLFQPLLYQIATASLSPADVATPIRGLFRDDANVRVLLGRVDRVDAAARRVHFGPNETEFDYLVLATGAMHSYFGHDDWASFAPGLKRIEDGVAVRCHVLGAFERAESSSDPDRIERLLTFVIVGAGPTGVELAGAIAELAHHGLRGEYRNVDPAMARVILVQSGDRILPAFPPDLSMRASEALERLGVEIRLNARVTNIEAARVCIGDHVIATETVLWAAGVIASPAGKWLGSETDPYGRVKVDEQLRIAGYDRIFAIGDTASSNGWDGKPVPGLAPAAKQAGIYVSGLIRADLVGQSHVAPFRYRHQGSMATIGRKAAVVDFGWMRLHGATAWWLWGAVHIGFLLGVRNRASVLVNWIWSYFTLKVGIRLITGETKLN